MATWVLDDLTLKNGKEDTVLLKGFFDDPYLLLHIPIGGVECVGCPRSGGHVCFDLA